MKVNYRVKPECSRLSCIAQWLMLLMPPLMYFGKGPVDTACSLVAALFLAHSYQQRDFSWAKPLWVKACLALWTYLVVHSLFQSDVLHSLSRAAPWGRYPVFAAALAYWVIRDKTFSKKLFISIAIGCSLLALDGWLQYFSGESIYGYDKWSRTRLTGPYHMPRLGATLAWIAFPVLIVCLHPIKAAWWRPMLKVFGGAAILLAILFSGDRSALLLTLLAIGLAGLFSPWLRWKMLWLAPLCILVAAAIFHNSPTLYKRWIGETQEHVGSFWQSPYGKITLDAWDIMQEHPWFGIGVKEYRNVSQSMREPQTHPHNPYLEMQTETGIFGLCLLLGLFAIWLRDMLRSYSLWKHDYLMMGLAIGVMVRLWPIISVPSFYASWNMIPLWIMVGWWYALQAQYTRADIPRA